MFVGEDRMVAQFKIKDRLVYLYKDFIESNINISIDNRSWRFKSVNDIKYQVIRDYINERLTPRKEENGT